MNIAIKIIVLISIFTLFSGCGKKDSSTPVNLQDTQPFKNAIHEYLKSKNYGMDLSSFEELSVSGNNASAMCRMNEAENLYTIKVTWQFDFENTGNGSWKVKSHTQK